jgi:hypothetical protein
MNSKLRKILRDVAIGALLGIFPNGKTDAAVISTSIDERLSLLSNNDPNISSNRPGTTLRYAYNFATDEGMFHRSHRSHSSHRSHYSSTSGTGTTTTPKTTTNSSTNSNAVVNQPRPIQNQNTIKANSSFNLGDRTLKFGMQGNDVLELKKALIKSKCYKVGEYEILDEKFDQKTHDALNLYKKNHQLTQDGLADAVVIYNIKNE